jgi:hypothetical protein
MEYRKEIEVLLAKYRKFIADKKHSNINLTSYYEITLDLIELLGKEPQEMRAESRANRDNANKPNQCMSCEATIKKDEALIFCGSCGT